MQPTHNRNRKRPISLTILGWYFIVGNLKGREWNRSLYIGSIVFGTAMAVLNVPMPFVLVLFPNTLMSALIAYLLYRRPATAYFQP